MLPVAIMSGVFAVFGDKQGVYISLDSRSSRESYGFFDDIAASDWCRLKSRAQHSPHGKGIAEAPNRWYQNNWEPAFTCLGEVRQGMGDGPKWICDPYRLKRGSCRVYSVGSNNNFDFEQAILDQIGPHCDVHTFDPGSSSSNKPASVTFHQWGLDNHDHGNYKTLASIARELGHDKDSVDIFKIDCEGCEWGTYEQWFKTIHPKQVMIELHAGTTGNQPVPAERFMRYMRSKGYIIFHKEPNTLGCGGSCIEYAFVRLQPSFWNTQCH